MVNVIFGLIGLLCAVWVIYDVFVKQKRMDTGEKIVWTIFAIVFSVVTAIVYYFMRKR